MTYPSGLIVQYQRDSLGQINQVSIREGGVTRPLIANVSYEPFGPPRQLTFANGRAIAKSHDQNYDLTQIRGIALNLDLARNDLGNIAEQSTPTQARSYRYDHLNRLEQVHDSSKVLQERYQYDPTGNRTERYKTSASAVTTTRYAYASASHHLVGQTSGVTATARTYDAVGNTLTNGAATYSYDQQNRFSQYQQGNTTETYRHNGQGQRISKTTSQRMLTSDGAAATAQTVYFVYDEQGQLIGEYTEAGRRIREYIYLGATPIATIDQAGNLAYIETDHLATPRALIDPARNQAIWTWDSLATSFGEHKPQQDPDRDGIQTVFNLRFPGQYFDEATKLHYNGFRTYDPSIGRYTQSDPLGLFDGPNPYLYAGANPIMYMDPYGLWRWGDPLPRGLVDFSAGTGDVLLLGFGAPLRNMLSIDGGVNRCSKEYAIGNLVGMGLSLAAGGYGGLRAAGARGGGIEFSHAFPARFFNPKSPQFKPLLNKHWGWAQKTILNGNYVSRTRHYLHDPYRYPVGWKAMGAKWPAPIQVLDRVPNLFKGIGLGVIWGTIANANTNDCECNR